MNNSVKKIARNARMWSNTSAGKRAICEAVEVVLKRNNELKGEGRTEPERTRKYCR